MPAQTVDATPSGIKLFSKVVFMKQGKRFGLSAEQKSDVWRRWKSGQTLHEIGRACGKEHSSIRCLVSRHGGIAPAVRRRALLALTLREREEISRGLASGSSIREIAKCLERAVSTVSRELLDQLRSKRRMRRSRHARASGQSRGQIVDAVSIRERPAEVEDRAVPGHWEGDLLAGAKNTYMATLVERHSRFAMLIKVPSKNTEVVVAALSQHVRKLPATLKRSLTWDRGLEMAKHKDFTVATDVKVYFCDPQSPWQRGTNENTNLLLRQYFPRGTDLSGYSQAQLDKVALRLNQR